jgi:protein-tyrosine-phosphatase
MEKVLFICMSNMRRSKMAQAIFENLTGHDAMSGGFDPSDKPDENVAIALKEVGIILKDPIPRRVTEDMMEIAGKIITFRCADKVPEKYQPKVENWEMGRKREAGEKPLERTIDDIRGSRDLIYAKVKELASRLGQAS